jgi:hypothetical protein
VQFGPFYINMLPKPTGAGNARDAVQWRLKVRLEWALPEIKASITGYHTSFSLFFGGSRPGGLSCRFAE